MNILKLMIVVLTMTHSVIMMVVNKTMFDNDLFKSEKWMIKFIISHAQNLFLKLYIIISDRGILYRFTIFQNYMIFPTLTLFTTLPRCSSINQIFLCISTNHKSSTEILQPNMVFDLNREKNIVFSFHRFLLQANIHFHWSWVEKKLLIKIESN